jgi:hypothetical protein
MLLQTEVRALRTELEHSQSIRSIERRDAAQSEARLKRRLADAYEEASQGRETIELLRAQVDKHSEAMEGSRQEWLQRLRWYEERWERETNDDDDEHDDDGNDDRDGSDRGRCALLRERLDATMDQVRGLEDCLRDAEARRASAEVKATDAARILTKREVDEADNDGEGGGAVVEIPRDLRIRLAETERANRELRRSNETLANRARDAIQDRERAASCGRKVAVLEREVRDLTRQVEEGREATRRWAEFRNVLVEEGGSLLSSSAEGEENDDDAMAMKMTDGEIPSSASSVVPPEIWTVVRKFMTLKRDARVQMEEIACATQLAEAHLRRCQSLESQLNEGSRSIAKLEKMVEDREARISRLEVENSKIIAREDIWKREGEMTRYITVVYYAHSISFCLVLGTHRVWGFRGGEARGTGAKGGGRVIPILCFFRSPLSWKEGGVMRCGDGWSASFIFFAAALSLFDFPSPIFHVYLFVHAITLSSSSLALPIHLYITR